MGETMATTATMAANGDAILRSKGYLQLLSYVVSNAREGEIMAVENYSEMVHLLPDTDSKIETVGQAKEECKHIALLEKVANTVGFPIVPTLVQAQWKNVRANFHESVTKNNVAGCHIIQDLMVESLAIGLYKLFASASNGDGETARVAALLLKDELDHLEIGVKRIKALLAADSESVHDTLVWAHHRVMPSLFDMVHNSCDFLCNSINLDCNVVEKPNVINLDMLKVVALEHYVDMIDKAGFQPRVANQLIASMTSYEVPGRSSIGIDRILKARCADSNDKSCC
jgi:fatty aldehyde decarbonylase